MSARSTTAAISASLSTRGSPSDLARTYTSHSHSSSRVASNASLQVGADRHPAVVGEQRGPPPPASAARTFAASSGVPYVAYSATRTGPPSSRTL